VIFSHLKLSNCNNKANRFRPVESLEAIAPSHSTNHIKAIKIMSQDNANIVRQWNGRVIRQRKDGYLSATDMCQAANKLWGNWYRLDSTKEYLNALESRRYSDLNNGKLIDIVQGGIPEEQGTWVYRKVALRLAQWLSPEFAVQVD
jgi:hypothetical protein